MLKVAVLVSGGGTNLQAILDAIDSGRITNAEVSLVISNNPNAYALERAKNHGIEAVCISPKEFENREGVQSYWIERLKEAGPYENFYTMGMRGIHDSGMEGQDPSGKDRCTATGY